MMMVMYFPLCMRISDDCWLDPSMTEGVIQKIEVNINNKITRVKERVHDSVENSR